MASRPDEPFNGGTAFGLWVACLFGLCGIHRFYLGKPGTGLLYLLTFGCFGIGQFIDLFRIPFLVREANLKHNALVGAAQPQLVAGVSDEQLRMALVRAAAEHGGRLTVTQGVMVTGKTFADVEAFLDGMVRSGYVGIGNDPDSGAVQYLFGELDR